MSINLSGRALKRLRLPVVNYYSSAYQVMSAQAGDVNTRYLDVVLYDDRGDIDLGAYSKVYLQVQAYDGISPQMSEGWIDTERNRAVCRLTSSMLQYTGSKMPCNIWLVGTDADDEPMSLTSQTFYVMVYEGHGGTDAEPSEDELTALQSAINDVVELEKTVGEAEANRQENFRSVYIKYSFDANGYNYTDSWQQGQQYMGVANTPEEPENAAGYSWILISGGSSGGSAVTVVGKNGYGFYRLAGEYTADTTNVATEDIQRRADREVQAGDMLITPEGLIFVLDEYDGDNDIQKVLYYADISGSGVSEEDIAAAVEMYMSENEIGGSGADDIDIVDEDGSYKLILTKDGEHIGSGVNMPTYTAEGVGAAEKDHNHDEKYQPKGNYAAEGHDHDGKYQPVGNYLTEESDPTVPSWAKQPTKPTYTADEVKARPNTWTPTAEDVGARPNTWMPTASDVGADAIVTDHNAATDSHNDIRLLIQGLDARLTALVDSDDTTLDQLSELVAYIKANRGLIESVTTNKVDVDDIINNLATDDAEKPLSAAQGVALNALIDALTKTVNGKVTDAQVATAISNALKAYPTTTAMQTAISTALADYAKADHNHDGVYASKSHDHAGVYQPAGSYAGADHNHDGTYAKPADIPTKLSQLAGDSTHRTVTDAEKTGWNGKAAGNHDHDGVYVKQTELSDAVNTALETAKDSPEVLVPNIAVAAVGVELNIYWADIVRSLYPLSHYWIWAKMTPLNSSAAQTYYNLDECFRFTPTTTGTYKLTITVNDRKSLQPINVVNYRGETVKSIEVTLTVVAKEIVSCTGIYIGDSLGAGYGGLTAATIQHELSDGQINFVGTQTGNEATNGLGTVKLESYNGAGLNNSASGEKARGFLTPQITSSNPNPFWNANTQVFDLDMYMTNQDISSLDFVVIALGHNQINNPNTLGYWNTIISQIRTSNHGATIPIFVSLMTKVGDKDSWSDNPDGIIYARNWWSRIRELLVEFDNGAYPNVYLTTQIWACDPIRMFPSEEVTRSARDTEKIYRQHDGMHPAKFGYKQIADAVYPYIAQAMGELGITTYSVTNNLINVTNSNLATSVKEGASYMATLTANSGYELDTVTVTMGGNAVTVTGGNINIPSVTGNIVITATAVETTVEPEIVNLVDPSTANDSNRDTTTFYKNEWVNGYYISSNGLSEKTGCITTNLFPLVKGQKLKIEGILCATAEHRNRNRWKVFDSAGQAVYSSYLNFMGGEVAGGSAGETSYDAATNTVIIDTSGLAVTFNNMAFVRFSCYLAGANEDLIVSVVE